MKVKVDTKKVVNELKQNGYCIVKNFLSKKEIDEIKKSLLNTLQYIKPDKQKNLVKKYYQIKKFNPILKGNWFDIISLDIKVLQFLYSERITKVVKKYFNTKVLFSGRRHLNIFDDANDKLLNPHQETHQIARDTIVLWAPLYDTGKNKGGIAVYKDSHKNGYFKHEREKIDKIYKEELEKAEQEKLVQLEEVAKLKEKRMQEENQAREKLDKIHKKKIAEAEKDRSDRLKEARRLIEKKLKEEEETRLKEEKKNKLKDEEERRIKANETRNLQIEEVKKSQDSERENLKEIEEKRLRELQK